MASSGWSRFFVAPKFSVILLLSAIIGELACGSISRRSEILQLLRRLPSVPVVENEEAMTFVERHRLMGRGVGWVDVHLLASAALGSILLWSADRRLAAIARSLGVYGEP